MNYDVVIIGGGVAGLAVANELVDAGKVPLLLTENAYPTHRICGEFYSPECAQTLQQWGVRFPVTFSSARFYSHRNMFEFAFPKKPLGLSRYACETVLARRVVQYGGIVKEKARVSTMHCDGMRKTIVCASGEEFIAPSVIIATGRHSIFAQRHWKPFASRKLPFIGIKAHFEGINAGSSVHMYQSPEAYVGISAIENDQTNIAALAKTDEVLKAGGVAPFMQKLLTFEYAPTLQAMMKSATRVFDAYMTCGIPPFGRRAIPHTPGIYYAGDVIGAITPLCGDGIAMGVTSGVMAARHVLSNTGDTLQQSWDGRYARRVRLGMILQRCMFKQAYVRAIWPVMRTFPGIAQKLFDATREP